MSDTENHNFHNFSLQSVLFKGRPDLYFCYLKSEKLAHALVRICDDVPEGEDVLHALLRGASLLPGSIARFAAGELEEASMLADLYETLSLVRLSVSSGEVNEQNGSIIAKEYEFIAEKISLGKNASPFMLSMNDLSVPPFADTSALPPSSSAHGSPSQKGHERTRELMQHKGHIAQEKDKGMSDRTSLIMKIIKEQKRVSIKDIARSIQGCSEKTIQRDLNFLIRQGFVRKEGERRWSVYLPADR